MSEFGQLDIWVIVNAVLEGIFIKPLSIIWLVSFCVVRQRDDPIRRPFHWMKTAYPLYIIALILAVVADGVSLVEESMDQFDDPWTFLSLNQVVTRLFDFRTLFENVAYIFLLLCLVDLGLSFLSFGNSQSKPAAHKIIFWTTAGIAGVLAVLAIARLGKSEALYTSYYNDATVSTRGGIYFPDFDFSQFDTVAHLTAAFDILLWVTAVPVMALAIFVMVKCAANIALRNSAVIFLVIAILYLLRNTWELAFDAKWLLSVGYPPEYIAVVDAILDAWVTFVILVLVFVIGCRKQKGLWSTQQPWMYSVDGSPGLQQQQQQQTGPSYATQGYVKEYQQQSPSVEQTQQGHHQPPEYDYSRQGKGPHEVQ